MNLFAFIENLIYKPEERHVYRVHTGREKAEAAARINQVVLRVTGRTGTTGLHELMHAVHDHGEEGSEMGTEVRRNRLFPWKILLISWHQSIGPRGIAEQIKTAEGPKSLMSPDDHANVKRLRRFID